MGFGGAFAALADDATAAFANPAGLVQIVRPEISLEGRSWSFSTPFTERGRLEGDPTGLGVDIVSGLRSGTSSEDVAGLSFLSFVYPKKTWSIAFYRHQLADFESLTQTQGLFGPGRFFDLRAETDLEILSHGISGAYRFSEAWSFGLSLVHYDGHLDLASEPFLSDTLGNFAPTSYLPERRIGRITLRIDDHDWGVTFGFLRWLSNRWRLGGFYREAPDFELRAETTVGPAGSLVGFPPEGTVLESVTTPSSFPDVYGLGLTFRSKDGRLTLAFEWDRVEYSTIFDSLDPASLSTENLVLEDGDELHLGAEYVFLRSAPVVAIRLGTWLDPDHRPSFSAGGTALERALLPPGGDEIHYTLGLGLVFESFQLDLGADFSDPVDTVSLSAIYSF